MKYIVKIELGYKEMNFEFTDQIKANMFAAMALKNIVKPDARYEGENTECTVTITLVSDEPQEAAEAEDNTEKEAE